MSRHHHRWTKTCLSNYLEAFYGNKATGCVTEAFNGNKDADPVTNVESHPCDEHLGEKKVARFASRCHIHVHSLRHRLADPDGLSFKACLDELVHGGIFENDTTWQISEVTFSQEKTTGPEETVVEIYEDLLNEQV